MRADCSKCVYFVPRSGMTPEQHRIAEQAALEKYGERNAYWGWCKKRDAPVLYLKGSCRYYEPKGRQRWPGDITKYLLNIKR